MSHVRTIFTLQPLLRSSRCRLILRAVLQQPTPKIIIERSNGLDMSRQPAKHWISVDEYERMGEAGIFHSNARLELLEGAIYEMPPIGSPHAACVTILHQLLTLKYAGKLIVISQNPIRLNDFSEPQPDV